MTTDMFLGGLMILMMVAFIVVALTSTRGSQGNRFDVERSSRNDRDSQGRNGLD